MASMSVARGTSRCSSHHRASPVIAERTIAARANAAKTGREAELDAALNEFCDEWNRGTADQARFEMQYLLAVGTRT
jgi:hypothetical protein